ncbi:hypothetical protein [Celeribacter litoreus]|uniref:hypothetical protein n=1 Tax=Celeribacter litoreus TaxID=2876714 RepID=UPI001CCA9638|nr:hypothetical protein [Celeribacter litoreus]MCA0042772.1 hypothetical protein [Celeribacter litoreus]
MSPALLFRLTSALSFALCAGLLIAPAFFGATFGLDPSVGGEVMARRAGLLFAPIGLIYLQLAGTEQKQVQRTLLSAGLLLMITMGLLGLTEWALGRVGPGILVAVLTEALFAALYVKAIRNA